MQYSDSVFLIEIIIGDPPGGPLSPRFGSSDVLMSHYHLLDPIHWFKFIEPWPMRDEHDELEALVGEHGDIKFCLLLPPSEVDFV